MNAIELTSTGHTHLLLFPLTIWKTFSWISMNRVCIGTTFRGDNNNKNLKVRIKSDFFGLASIQLHVHKCFRLGRFLLPNVWYQNSFLFGDVKYIPKRWDFAHDHSLNCINFEENDDSSTILETFWMVHWMKQTRNVAMQCKDTRRQWRS